MDLDQLQREADAAGLGLDVRSAFAALDTRPLSRLNDPPEPGPATSADRYAALCVAEPWLWKHADLGRQYGVSAARLKQYLALLRRLPLIWTRDDMRALPEFDQLIGAGRLSRMIAQLAQHDYVEILSRGNQRGRYRTLRTDQ